MTYKFIIDNSILHPCGKMTGTTDNVNTYICNFDIKCDFENMKWFCTFKNGEKIYADDIIDNKCTIPIEVLQDAGTVSIGCFAISEQGGLSRISTNFVQLEIEEGAYCRGRAVEEPEPELWESLVFNAAPKIGENGNWHVYDSVTLSYKDTGIRAVAEDGYTPVREVDYWNKEDKEAIKRYIDKSTAKIDEKEDKSIILLDKTVTEYVFEFSTLENKEMRVGELKRVAFEFGDGEYANDYVSGFTFDSPDVPTAISYTDSGILNWVGTDCATKDGISIFQPSPNIHYDILFYFNGVQFVAMVNGFSVSAPQGV